MTYDDRWKAISNRVRGLTRAGELHGRFLANQTDSYGRHKQLRLHCEQVLEALRQFEADYRSNLPALAVEALHSFIGENTGLISDTSGTNELQNDRVSAALVMLAALEANITFVLADSQEGIKTRSERAFTHLQRSIVADADVRKKWNDAFVSGEVACEKLGGVHLLSHGIYAFKVDGGGGITDLVFEDPVSTRSDELKSADGLVLTEWKVAKPDSGASRKYAEAKTQANLYTQGVLGGSELRHYRYLVVVSKNYVPVPPNAIQDGTTFRHINIAVDPAVPSKAAVKLSKTS